MRARTTVHRQQRGAREVARFAIELELAKFPEGGSGSDEYLFEFAPLEGPVIAFIGDRAARVDKDGTLINKWATAARAPSGPRGFWDGLDPLDEQSFWSIFEARPSDSANVRMNRIRKRLERSNLDFILGFQTRLIEVARHLVERFEIPWCWTVGIILSGRDFYDLVASGRRRPPSDGFGEFSDLADLAEEACGGQIHVDRFGTSRSAVRDLTPELPPDATSAELVEQYGVSVYAWDRLPWRWHGFRANVHVASAGREVVVIANRAWGTSLGQLSDDVRALINAQLGNLMTPLEMLDPEIMRPGRATPPIYYVLS